ncbi:MAG: methyltransferase domain-containing protein [Planctomycetes bacterium]|nr:methyltransferase domain-containing protein [Planctomycetota bacterium]
MSRRPRDNPRTNVNYHDRVAPVYDAQFEGDRYWELLDEITWQTIKALLPSDLACRILDAGGGTGRWGLRLARSGYGVTISDLSPGMLDVAREKAAALRLSRAPEFVQSDIADLKELPDGAFGLALALGDPISFCSSPEGAARALYRCLAPGGVVLATVDSKWAGLHFYLERGAVLELETFLKTGMSDWQAKDPGERFPSRHFAPEEISRIFAAAGFEIQALRGKPVLPLRRFRRVLEDPGAFDRLLRLELKLRHEPTLIGNAPHLEIVGRKARG